MFWALERTLYRRYSPAVEGALAEQRILIFAVRNACRSGWQTAQTRNYLIASMCVYAMNIEDRSSSFDVLYDLDTKMKTKTVFLFKTS